MELRLEHFALNVSDPTAMAAWYVSNLGMKIKRKSDASHHTHFLADCNGNVMVEIYNNPSDEVPDYSRMNPLLVHVAFSSDDPTSDKEALLLAGATFESESRFEDGTHLIMLRDPWGLALQLCKRAVPML